MTKINYNELNINKLVVMQRELEVRIQEMATNSSKDKVVRDELEKVRAELLKIKSVIKEKRGDPRVEFGKKAGGKNREGKIKMK